MENASKALIIAGAILLAILIISLGILIFQQASSVIDSNAMSAVERQSFNSQFTQYEGERVNGTTVRTLIQAVFQNNLSADSTDRQIIIKQGNSQILGETDTSASTALSKISTGSTYTVTCEYSTSGGDAGLVNVITITTPDSGQQ